MIADQQMVIPDEVRYAKRIRGGGLATYPSSAAAGWALMGWT